MFSKVSVLIPTRMRIWRLQILLESYNKTKGLYDSELIFRVDEDDIESQNFLSGSRVIVGPRHKGYASMPQFFNELAAEAGGDVLMCGNDDMVFRTPDWAGLILDKANEYPDGIFNIGVSTYNQAHYPFSIVSQKVVEALGFIWDPRIFWGDIYLRDVMGTLGRLVMLPNVQIDHDWAGYNPDKVFKETRPSKHAIETSPNYWPNIHQPAVNDAVNKLRRLVGEPNLCQP